MVKFHNWPFWLQMLVVTPHAILVLVLLGFWWPRSAKQWGWYVGLLAYLWLFYLIFVR